jgi:hypothetical protein
MTNIEKQISDFARTILHCGDYGQTYFNPQTGVVHWVGGDSDGGHDLIKNGFMSIEGVKDVVIADEWFPEDDLGDTDEEDWVEVFNPENESRDYWESLDARLKELDSRMDQPDIDWRDIDISDLFKK